MFALPSSSTCPRAPARRPARACSTFVPRSRSVLGLRHCCDECELCPPPPVWDAATRPTAACCICFSLSLFFFFKLCGSWARCDLLRFPAFWSWLTGAFMHLVFPPLFPSGLLKSEIPPTTLKRANALAGFFFFFFFLLLSCAGIFALAAAAEQMF